MDKRKLRKALKGTERGIELPIECHRSAVGRLTLKVKELEAEFPGIKLEVGLDPLEGKTALDFAPDPPPQTRHCTVYAPYPEYKIGDYSLAGIVSIRNTEGKTTVWTREEGLMSREEVENADFLRCDHCKTRRNRKALFFFENEAGKRLQIGTKCSKDYFGINLESELRKMTWALSDELAGEVENESYGGGLFSGLYPAEYTVPVAVILVERHGYLSQAKAEAKFGELATSHALNAVLYPAPRESESTKEDRMEVIGAAKAREEEIKKVFEAYKLEVEEKKATRWTEFLHNLTENFAHPTMGMAAFMAFEMVGKRAERTKKVASKRLERDLGTKMADLGTFTLTLVREEDGRFGVSYFHVAKNEETGETVMFRRSHTDLEVGDIITLRGKVKKHLDTATVVGYPKIKEVGRARSDEERARDKTEEYDRFVQNINGY